MKKQKTFQSRWEEYPYSHATEWLHDLSKCFFISSAKITSYRVGDSFEPYRCKVEVVFR